MNEAISFFTSVFYDPSFIGASTGAVITGGLALYINSLERNRTREREIEESKKVLLVFQYFAQDMDFLISKIFINIDEINKVYDPYSEIETYEDEEGYERIAYHPADEEVRFYEMKIKPFSQKVKDMSKEALTVYGKIDQVNINSLRLKEAEYILKFKSDFKKTIEPILLRFSDTNYPNIGMQEIDVIKLVSKNLLDITNKK